MKRDIVWSYGGGTQSAAIAVLVIKGILPKPDYAAIADTSYEMSETWEYLEAYVQPALSKVGVKIEIVPHTYSSYDLYQNDYLLLPTYTTINGHIGKKPTRCSGFWKMKAIRRWLRQQGVQQCDTWLGISTDEFQRMKQSDKKWNRNTYPLIDLRISRNDCYQIVSEFGWKKPPTSHCYMCPNQGLDGWRYLRKYYPGDFDKAVQLEHSFRLRSPYDWLHRSGKPLDVAVNMAEESPGLFDICDSGYCVT